MTKTIEITALHNVTDPHYLTPLSDGNLDGRFFGYSPRCALHPVYRVIREMPNGISAVGMADELFAEDNTYQCRERSEASVRSLSVGDVLWMVERDDLGHVCGEYALECRATGWQLRNKTEVLRSLLLTV